MNQKKYLDFFLHAESGMAYFIEHFFFVFNHEGECGTPQMIQRYLQNTSDRPRLFSCVSKVYRRYKQLQKESPISELKLTDHELAKCFSKECSDEQRFAILFAKWYGLSDTQIKQIANRHNAKLCLPYLNWFLCHPEEQLPAKDSMQLYLPDGLNYEVWVDGICKKAHIQGGKLLLDGSGEILEIA